MKPVRRLILPALVAAPAAMGSVGLAVIGPPGFTRFTFTPDGLLVWAALTLAGVLAGGITAAIWALFNADMLADRPERMA